VYRFSSLRNAYARIGYKSRIDYSFVDDIAAYKEQLPSKFKLICQMFEAHKLQFSGNFSTRTIQLRNGFSIFISLTRAAKDKNGVWQWIIRLPSNIPHDLVIIPRIAHDGDGFDGFLVLRKEEIQQRIITYVNSACVSNQLHNLSNLDPLLDILLDYSQQRGMIKFVQEA
jgi:hypothetical protein